MSDGPSSYAAGVIAEFKDVIPSLSVDYASTAMVLYEDVITFEREVELFWGQRLTAASVLFFLNRYITIALLLSNLFGGVFSPASLQVRRICAQLVFGVDSSKLLLYFPWAAFSALRVFALTGGQWVLSAFVFLLSTIPIVVNFVDFHWHAPTIDPFFGCSEGLSETVFISKLFTGLSRGPLIVADTIVIIVTRRATYKTTRLAREVEGRLRTSSLSLVLLRDGTIYFVVIWIMNVLHLIFSVSDVFTFNDSISDISLFLEPMESILISRFLMNLQEANMRLTNWASLDPTSCGDGARATTTIRFSDGVIASLGNSIYTSDELGVLDDSIDASKEPCAEEEGVAGSV